MNRHLSQSDTLTNALVLIAEDEPEICEILEAYFSGAGLRTARAPNGRVALEMHARLKPDLVLLDVQMPEMDGWQVLSQLRLISDTPVLMLTALDQNLDKLMGLRLGADDYVVKPFNAAEVVARVIAILRRTINFSETNTKLIRLHPFEIDLESHLATVDVNGRRHTLALTLTEFKLLARLVRAPNKVFSREELTVHCLNEGDQLLRAVDSHFSNLRKKLEEVGLEGIPIGVRGVGYRLWSLK
ncbi:response regulator [Comamonas testosteroni]|uniref:response regulator n=1 Tax=Comamonas testosteroni TaxID=285 RepID=UPI0006909960|nr:response regulator [Comamonas testosteroni]